ncbi:hypothetical protein BDV12DRAFT_210242 [Aspergillus spectabilis]
MAPESFDAVIVGAGFGGIYQLYSLLKLGLTVKVIDQASGAGGTWFWNRYPGAMSDTPSHLYRYSWDKEDLQSYPWSHNYLDAKEILAYLEHVIKRHDLRKHMQFNTSVLSAIWNDDDHTWTVETDKGALTTRYFVTALGLVTEPNWPSIPGRDKFRGGMLHPARWPEQYELQGKRVAVIGNGATGVQLISSIAPVVGSLLCFQRHPQYTIPAGRHAVTQDIRDSINKNYDEIWQQVRESYGGMGVVESKIKAMSVSDEERERIYQAAWDEGGAFRFLLGTFVDLVSDETANCTASEFLKDKIAQIVQDPEKRRKLTPTELYARRPICNTGYYEQFNRDNVDIVDVAQNPIVEFTTNGIKLADGVVHELDVIICATGYDAFDGPYRKIKIIGRDEIHLAEHWNAGPSSNMGLAVANFPNLFMINGPQSPLANFPIVLESQVDFIAELISRAESRRESTSSPVAIESKLKADQGWGMLCQLISDSLLFKTTDSYLYGKNVEGKSSGVYLFLGGLGFFLQKMNECRENGYSLFHPF